VARDASLSPGDADPRLDRLQIRPHGGLLYALFFVLLGPARAQPPAPEAQGQTLEGRSLVDHDAGFTLTIPSTDWRLASEPDARALVADAVAGAMGKNGHFGMVVVEDMAADLDAMNDLALDSLDSVVTDGISQEKITFQGQPAIRSVLELNINDIRLRQQRVVFEWDRHFFQLVCNGPLTPADNRCSEFVGGFKLNGTAFRTRERAPIPDVQTRRWRVKDGQFESAVSGLTLRPPPGWRLMVGGELQGVSASADVGLARDRPEAYAILISEPAGQRRHLRRKKIAVVAAQALAMVELRQERPRALHHLPYGGPSKQRPGRAGGPGAGA
jgi:hypothetical protein